jgi:poly(A) polymerase
MSRLDPYWLKEPTVQRLLAAFAAAGIEARFVGGCVRDALLGIVGGDIDLATPAPPETVIAALKAARIKVLSTGIAHGTVTAIVDRVPVAPPSQWPPAPRGQFEITTLRRDIETDGRHAKVAFDAGWNEDAARRDFTINAIYIAPDGTLFDPVGGQADLAAHRVRFVGDAATRIAEDVLRILRYYRFEARFGSGDGDADARTACRDAAAKLPTLSAERVWRELRGLLPQPNLPRVLGMMDEDGILAVILPEATRLDRLTSLVRARGDVANPVPNGLLRLAALIDVDRAGANKLAERLRLSIKERKELSNLAKPWPIGADADAKTQRLALYRIGRDAFLGIVMLLDAEEKLSGAKLRDMFVNEYEWKHPTFPIGGADIIALGMPPGPRVGRLLTAVKRWWEDGDFTADRAACLAKLKELAART